MFHLPWISILISMLSEQTTYLEISFPFSELLLRCISFAKGSFLFIPGGVSFMTLVLSSLFSLIELFRVSPIKEAINLMWKPNYWTSWFSSGNVSFYLLFFLPTATNPQKSGHSETNERVKVNPTKNSSELGYVVTAFGFAMDDYWKIT